jgi:hypothetical protein
MFCENSIAHEGDKDRVFSDGKCILHRERKKLAGPRPRPTVTASDCCTLFGNLVDKEDSIGYSGNRIQ